MLLEREPHQQHPRTRLQPLRHQPELVVLVRLVAADQGVDQMRVRADIGSDMLQCADILGQARTAKRRAGAGIGGRDIELGIGDENFVHLPRRNIELLANPADLIGEGDLYRVPGVVDEFGQLGLADADMESRRLDAEVERLHVRARLPVHGADHDLGRGEIILYRTGFAQEFGIVDQFHKVASALPQSSAEDRQDQLLARSGAHGGAVGDGQRAGAIGANGGGHIAGDLHHEAHVMRAIDPAGGADADNRHIAIIQRIAHFAAGAQSPGSLCFGHKFIEPRLAHRRAPGIDRGDFGFADIHADNRMALTRDAARSSTADIAQSENGNLH